MKSVSLKMTMIILACILLASVIAHAQDDNKKVLEGERVFKSISSFDGEWTQDTSDSKTGQLSIVITFSR
ncbi:MAG: hypothetical protein LBH91_05265 [Prevotellaceae bacterium]|jgi:hypothetical protein|nr:hypothetical protein [Prevotellaceae bacterium]